MQRRDLRRWLSAALVASVLALLLWYAQARRDPSGSPKLLLAESGQVITGQALLEELRKGGNILFFRHFHTDHTRWHEDPIKPHHAAMAVKDFLASCDQQRPLTDFGRRRAKDVGTFISRLDIPIGTVLSSPYCRAVESASLLAGRAPDDTPYGLVHRGGELTYEMMARNVRPYLGAIPKPATNTLIVGHRPQMDDIRFIEEGECFVLKPLGDGNFKLVGTIYDSDWYEAQTDIEYLGLRGQQPGGDEPPRGVTK
jgi:phosphohistidine phosphatase SixA